MILCNEYFAFILHVEHALECFNTAIGSELMIQKIDSKIPLRQYTFMTIGAKKLVCSPNCVHLSLSSQMKFWRGIFLLPSLCQSWFYSGKVLVPLPFDILYGPTFAEALCAVSTGKGISVPNWFKETEQKKEKIVSIVTSFLMIFWHAWNSLLWPCR